MGGAKDAYCKARGIEIPCWGCLRSRLAVTLDKMFAESPVFVAMIVVDTDEVASSAGI